MEMNGAVLSDPVGVDLLDPDSHAGGGTGLRQVWERLRAGSGGIPPRVTARDSGR
ncbi:hypothetical protein ABZS77_10800 [Micromonospora sp. NPDC005298]|uniref:hypothetical protein n=1 Tax=Micromonospora sp. NPDC005298 TaxID=3156873 RepID=UPI0033A54A22